MQFKFRMAQLLIVIWDCATLCVSHILHIPYYQNAHASVLFRLTVHMLFHHLCMYHFFSSSRQEDGLSHFEQQHSIFSRWYKTLNTQYYLCKSNILFYNHAMLTRTMQYRLTTTKMLAKLKCMPTAAIQSNTTSRNILLYQICLRAAHLTCWSIHVAWECL